MKDRKANSRRMLAIILGAVLGLGAVAGIAVAVRMTTSSAVMVIRASGVNYGGGYDWENSVSGVITTDAEQSIYLGDTEKVAEVLVTQGQAVHRGDVLLRYDTTATALNLEKEKIAREKILLDLEVARTNQKTLDRITPVSDDLDLLDDFGGFDEYEEEELLQKAAVYKTKLTEKSKPANATGNDEDDEFLGSEDDPYRFICEGDEITITPEFIARWQKFAREKGRENLYVAIEKRDKDNKMALEKAWIVDVMTLDPEIAVDLDLTTGEAFYSGMNKPEKMAKLLRKILKEVPEDERGAWLAAMMDKLLVTTEKEEKRKIRGELLASMLDELTLADQKEFAAAASRLDAETVAVILDNLTDKQIKGLDEETLSGLLTMLLTNMTPDQIRALDGDLISVLLGNLTADQLTALPAGVLSQVLGNLSSGQLTEVLDGLSPEKRQEILEILTRGSGPDEGGSGDSGEQGGSGGEGSGDSDGQGGSGDSGSGSDDQGGSEGGTDQGGSGDDKEKPEQENQGNTGAEGSGSGSGTGQDGSGSSQEQSGSAGSGGSGSGTDTGNGSEQGGSTGGESSGSETDRSGDSTGGSNQEADSQTTDAGSESGTNAAPSTAPAPAGGEEDSGQKGGSLIASDAEYSSEELAQEKRELVSTIKELELDLRESDLKIQKAQRALDEGEVKASMNGVIKKVGDPGNPPKDGSPFLTLAGSDGLFVRSAIRENLLGSLGEGDRVTVTSWQDGSAYEAVIGSVSPYPDNSGMFGEGDSNTYYPFTALIENNNTDFKNGDWVEVSYTASGKAPEEEEEDAALYLWNAFIRDENGKKYVYKRGEDGRLHKQYIETGELSDSCYRIISGVTEDDWIAFPYGSNVEEGARTREASMEDIYRG